MIWLFSTILLSLLNTEEVLTFWLPQSLQNATIILEAEIVDASGGLKINEFYRGHLDSSHIVMDELSSPSRFRIAAYTPSNNLVHQKCLLFLRELDGEIIPAIHLGEPITSAHFIVSMVWVINDSIYYADREDSTSPLFFSKHYDKKTFLNIIQRHNKSIYTFAAALNYSDEHKAETLKASLDWTMVREPTISELGRTGIPGVKALRELLSKGTYTFEYPLFLRTLVDSGGEAVFSEIDSIFQFEFNYWTTNIASLRGTSYWGHGSFDPRYSYLSSVVYVMAENNMPGWQKNAISVREFFKNEKSYKPPNGWRRIDEGMDSLLKRYKN